MSNKAKNLTYEMEEPAFLRRLRRRHAGGGGPDRYISPRNRKTAIDDDEDAPTYVLEGAENETISREEFKAMASGKGEIGGEEREAEPEKLGEKMEGDGEDKAIPFGKNNMGRAEKENVIDIGVKGKKRKATKIGGDGEADNEAEEKEEKIQREKGKLKTGKKVKKPIKLSFDED